MHAGKYQGKAVQVCREQQVLVWESFDIYL